VTLNDDMTTRLSLGVFCIHRPPLHAVGENAFFAKMLHAKDNGDNQEEHMSMPMSTCRLFLTALMDFAGNEETG
jgi:hypothetical protein